jgi:foldase protein PrsA
MRSRRSLTLLLLAFLPASIPTVGAAAPAKPGAPAAGVAPALPSKAPATAAVAIVNGEAIPLAAYLDRLSVNLGAGVRDGLIEELLVRQEAKRRRLTASAADLERVTDRIYKQTAESYGGEARLIETLKATRGWSKETYRWVIRSQAAPQVLREKLAATLVPASAVTDAETAARYEEARALFAEPDSVRISHILIAHPENAGEGAAARARAQRLLDRIRLGGGASFEQVARESSDDKATAAQGGKLPLDLKRGQHPYGAAFDAAVFNAGVGLVPEVVAAPDGYHVVRVDTKTPGRQLPLSEVREQVRASLLQEKREEAMEKLFLRLRTEAKISVGRF